MTIVEVVDSHNGFNLIKDIISTKPKPKLLVLVTIITFFQSSISDNVIIAIVMTSLRNQLVHEKKDRLWFVSMAMSPFTKYFTNRNVIRIPIPG